MLYNILWRLSDHKQRVIKKQNVGIDSQASCVSSFGLCLGQHCQF